MFDDLPKLDNCPFCNGKAHYHYSDVPMVCCDRCQAQIRGAKIYKVNEILLRNYLGYLAALWNRRVGV